MSLDKYSLYGEIGGRPIRDRHDVLGDGSKGAVHIQGLHCIYKGCGNIPDKVCQECQEYVCNEHKYRHPDCDEGK